MMTDTIEIFTAEVSGDGRGFNVNISAPDFQTFTLTRSSANGMASGVVRGALNADLSGLGAAYLSDIEVPQNTAVQYLLEVARTTPDALTVTSDWLTATGVVDNGGNVIFDLARSSTPQRVLINSWGAWDHDLPAEKVWVDGRADPIIISSVRRMPATTLTLTVLNDADYSRIMSAIAGGITCLAPRYPDQAGIPGGIVYLSTGKVSETRMRQFGQNAARLISIEVQQITAPPADFIPQTALTWDEAYALGLTWDVLAARYTWDELAYG